MGKEIYSDGIGVFRRRLFDIEIDPAGVEWWVFKQGKGKEPFRVPYEKIIKPQIAEIRKLPSVDP